MIYLCSVFFSLMKIVIVAQFLNIASLFLSSDCSADASAPALAIITVF